RSRAADTAARSVTRTISSVRMRSSNNCGGTEIWVDISALPQALTGRPLACRQLPMRDRFARASILFDPDHLRTAADHLVALHGGQRAMHRILMGGIGDQKHGHRRSLAGLSTIGMTLHDGLDRNLLLGQALCDGRPSQ